MPFPFLPLGAALALTVLGGAFALFSVLLHLADRAALAARDSVAPGLIAGWRRWGPDSSPARATSPQPGEPPALVAFQPSRATHREAGPGEVGSPDEQENTAGAIMEELPNPAAADVPVHRLHPRR